MRLFVLGLVLATACSGYDDLGLLEIDGVEPREIEPGTTLLERYRVVDTIGRGGFGTVYLARDSAVSEDLVLKVLEESAVEGTYWWGKHDAKTRRRKDRSEFKNNRRRHDSPNHTPWDEWRNELVGSLNGRNRAGKDRG